MRCKKPRTVGFQTDGKSIAWSQKQYSKEYPTFQLPCGKCISCRLEYSRQWAVRATHEASIHSDNCFITLTYDQKFITNYRLNYTHFQNFMQSLRDYVRSDCKSKNIPFSEIGFMVCGEYGEQNKRPHWHACIFGWKPSDAEYKYSSDLGDKIYTSELLGPKNKTQVEDDKNRLWNYGIAEFGSVTFKSAGYIARYSTKKLTHGNDNDHDYNPIFKTSRKYAIGKRWLQKYWSDVFNHGKIILRKPDGSVIKCGVPRYYEKWLRENHLDDYVRYLTDVKYPLLNTINEKEKQNAKTHFYNNFGNPLTLTRAEVENQVLEDKRKRILNKYLKL